MQIYLVGGAVRDTLLGLPVKDRDWVVVGATPQQLVDQGFIPVGKDFPVFLHPRSHEQYALARTERKTAPGYRGFAIHSAPDVTLEQDLARRDLTINAMAVAAASVASDGSFDPACATLLDPHHGRRDLQHRLLRHVGDAFREDPVRILRVARFAARFADFGVAPETMLLMRAMVADGEVAALVAERVWQELASGLMEAAPARMLSVLRACGALGRLLPEIDALWPQAEGQDAQAPHVPTPGARSPGDHLDQVLALAVGLQAPLPVRFAGLCLPLATPAAGPDTERKHTLTRLCQRLRVPTECRELAEATAREHAAISASGALDALALVRLLERCDAFRKPERFAQMLLVCECDTRAGSAAALNAQNALYAPKERLLAALAAAQTVATDLVAERAQAAGARGPEIGDTVRAARAAAIAALRQR